MNSVALVPLPTPLQAGQVVTLLWTGRGGVPAYLDGTPAVVLEQGRRWVLVGTEDGARRVALDNVSG